MDDNQWTGDDGDGWMMAAADLKMMRFRVMVMASSIVTYWIWMIPNWIGEDGCQNSESFFGGARICLAGSRFLLRPKWPRSFEIHNNISS